MDTGGSFLQNSNNESFELLDFLSNVDWTEKWLVGVIAFHICMAIITLCTRNHHTLQGLLFVALLSLVCSTEILNGYGAKHWKYFSKQQYFDSSGMFISTIVSMPALFNCLMMVINWLWLSSSLIVKLKRVELERHLARAKDNRRDQKKEN